MRKIKTSPSLSSPSIKSGENTPIFRWPTVASVRNSPFNPSVRNMRNYKFKGILILQFTFFIFHFGVQSVPPPMVSFLAQSSVEGSNPNVLFISVDDMNDWVGCLGSDRVPSPHIDALADRGLLFTHAHALSPKCTPSRAACPMNQFLTRAPPVIHPVG